LRRTESSSERGGVRFQQHDGKRAGGRTPEGKVEGEKGHGGGSFRQLQQKGGERGREGRKRKGANRKGLDGIKGKEAEKGGKRKKEAKNEGLRCKGNPLEPLRDLILLHGTGKNMKEKPLGLKGGGCVIESTGRNLIGVLNKNSRFSVGVEEENERRPKKRKRGEKL